MFQFNYYFFMYFLIFQNFFNIIFYLKYKMGNKLCNCNDFILQNKYETNMV